MKKNYIYLCLFILLVSFIYVYNVKETFVTIPQKMVLKHSDTHCLDAYNNQIILKECNGSPSQVWYSTQIPDSMYSKLVHSESKKCLNENLQLDNCENISTLQWLFSKQTLQNPLNKCLDVSYNLLSMNECTTDSSQKWNSSIL